VVITMRSQAEGVSVCFSPQTGKNTTHVVVPRFFDAFAGLKKSVEPIQL